MNKKVWTGLLAGVLAAGVLLSVGLGAFWAGQRESVTVTRVAGDGKVIDGPVTDGGVVRVIDDGRWGHGPGPGFFLFPLLAIGLVVLLVGRGRRGGYGGPGGWCGPGPERGWGPEARMEEWHRKAHEEPSPATPPPTG